jgi:hypothetical protein
MEIKTLNAARVCIKEDPNYHRFNGKTVTITVIANNTHSVDFMAKGGNGRIIELNGYAYADTIKELCDSLGVICTY